MDRQCGSWLLESTGNYIFNTVRIVQHHFAFWMVLNKWAAFSQTSERAELFWCWIGFKNIVVNVMSIKYSFWMVFRSWKFIAITKIDKVNERMGFGHCYGSRLSLYGVFRKKVYALNTHFWYSTSIPEALTFRSTKGNRGGWSAHTFTPYVVINMEKARAHNM